ncbi:hypothetical protein A8B79_03355 [Balneola sp. EhC07]|uniref:hypothetical protein n=1 Tax=Balneola sp. EhC07 TaxID=1849360 RepID=UPI0007F3C885|nr:hypothetical protein [Balneola sp. EhC07]OAN62596.1 hypothetical protein A8B79_03355 [Balneola sp. EhC07]
MPEIWIFLKITLFDNNPDSCLRRNDFDCELGRSGSVAEHRNQIKIEIMEVVTALILVLVITIRNKAHKDPETILNQVQHMVQDDGFLEILQKNKKKRLVHMLARA